MRFLENRTRRQNAFTMVEIALCLAIVGFALVVIMGVLPLGGQAQKKNRKIP
jgi:type II secretory pathway pseudopilin PulG